MGIGLEPTLGEWVANIVAVMREVKRALLRDDGTCWLNLGDAHTSGGRSTSKADSYGGPSAEARDSHHRMATPNGLQPKDLMGQPWRVAFALQDDGWLLRSAIVWHKPNPMPESVRDRPTNAYEMLFLLAKQGRYFYDAEALKEPQVESTIEAGKRGRERQNSAKHGGSARWGDTWAETSKDFIVPGGRNARNVWSIPTQGRPDAHFATYPDELPRRCILAGTSERGVCADCGAPWVRVPEKETATVNRKPNPARIVPDGVNGSGHRRGGFYGSDTQTLGWQPTCGCNADTVPATVLDPFAGSGTTLAVAQALGRKSVGLDLNAEYLEIAKRYINRADGITLPMVLS